MTRRRSIGFAASTSWMMIAAVLAIGIVTIGCSSNPSDPNNPGSRPSGTLYMNGDNKSNTYSLDLTTGATQNLFPGKDAFRTPEGTFIAYSAEGLVEFSANGLTSRLIVRQVTDDGSANTFNENFHGIQLSPDGKYIAYESNLANQHGVYVVDRTTGELLVSMQGTDIVQGYVRPSWTPDNRIVVAGRGTNPGIFITDVAWTALTRIDNITLPTEPQVSPDGKSIALIVNNDIYTMNIDGSGLKQITNTTSVEQLPTWSPDGKYIAFYGENSIGSNSIILLNVASGTAFDVRSISTAVDQFFTYSGDLSGQFYWQQRSWLSNDAYAHIVI